MTGAERVRRWRERRRGNEIPVTKTACNETAVTKSVVELEARIIELQALLRAECTSNRVLRSKLASGDRDARF